MPIDYAAMRAKSLAKEFSSKRKPSTTNWYGNIQYVGDVIVEFQPHQPTFLWMTVPYGREEAKAVEKRLANKGMEYDRWPFEDGITSFLIKVPQNPLQDLKRYVGKTTRDSKKLSFA